MQYIDIEGTDGSGKATQTKLLYEYLVGKGYKCKVISFPNYASRSSEPVKMYLSGELGDTQTCPDGYQISALYAVDRMLTMWGLDSSELDFVLFDRYTPSNMIHQSTKIDDEEELVKFLDWVADFEYGRLKLPVPDKTLFLDVPPEVSVALAHARKELKNGQAKDILEADASHIYKAYERAKYVAKRYNWQRIDCTNNGNIKSIEEIHREILATLNL